GVLLAGELASCQGPKEEKREKGREKGPPVASLTFPFSHFSFPAFGAWMHELQRVVYHTVRAGQGTARGWRQSIRGGAIRRLGRWTGCVLVAGLGLARPAFAQREVPGDLIVRRLHFEGNHAIDTYTLSISIATSNSTWWFRQFGWAFLGEKRFFDELEFRRDVLRIQALYRLSGYLEARVDTLVRRTPKDVHIDFVITEGEPVRIAEITVTGSDPAMPAQDLVSDLPLKGGKAFSRFFLRASADSIRRRLQ